MSELDDLIKQRDSVQAKLSRLQGRYDSALQDKRAVEEECRAKNIDPQDIDKSISQLEAALAEKKEALRQAIEQAEQAITPYIEDLT